jgi:hypothetical protein
MDAFTAKYPDSGGGISPALAAEVHSLAASLREVDEHH